MAIQNVQSLYNSYGNTNIRYNDLLNNLKPDQGASSPVRNQTDSYEHTDQAYAPDMVDVSARNVAKAINAYQVSMSFK